MNFGFDFGFNNTNNKKRKEKEIQRKFEMSDGNPERRNLVLLSMAIILYYIADGEVVDNALRLQFINIEFKNFKVLGTIVWVILFWFLFRYRITTIGIFKKEFFSELNNISKAHPLLVAYVKRFLTDYEITKESNTDNYAAYINSHRDKNRGGYRYIYGIKHKTSTLDNERSMSAINNLLSWFVFIVITIHTAIVRPSFSAYIVPYFIFLTAIILCILKS